MKRKGTVEDTHCPKCGMTRTCEIRSVSTGGALGTQYVRYLCSSEHEFRVRVGKRKAPWKKRK
jgi:hypothetical protein